MNLSVKEIIQMKYCLSNYCDIVPNGDYVVIVNHELGFYLKLRKKIWNNIIYYIEKDLEVDFNLQAIFDDLLHRKIIIEEGITEYETIMLQITNKCNLKCKHCCVTELTSKGEVNYEVIDEVIGLNPKSIVLSGGEPMLHSKFWSIIEYIKKIFHGKMVLSTNGLFISEKNVDNVCKYFDKISISLDGLSEQNVEKIRGRGVYHKVMQTIRLLKKKNMEIEISSIVLNENDREIKQFEEQFGMTILKRELNILGRAKLHLKDMLEGGVDEYIRLKSEDFMLDQDIDLYKCGMLQYELYVSLDGNIYPCPGLATDDYVLGNIRDFKNVEEIQRKSNRKFIKGKMLKNDKFKRCRNCNYIGLCWTCLSVIEGFSNVPKVFERWCDSRKALIKKILEE